MENMQFCAAGMTPETRLINTIGNRIRRIKWYHKLPSVGAYDNWKRPKYGRHVALSQHLLNVLNVVFGISKALCSWKSEATM